MVQLIFGEPAFEERPRVHTRSRVALEIDLVAATRVILAPEKVVETYFVQRRRRSVRTDVTTGTPFNVGAMHHHGRVPPNLMADTPLKIFVARKARFALRRDRVDVVGGGQRRNADVALAGPLQHLQQKKTASRLAMLFDHRIERFEPFCGLAFIDVWVLRRQPISDDGVLCVVLLFTHL